MNRKGKESVYLSRIDASSRWQEIDEETKSYCMGDGRSDVGVLFAESGEHPSYRRGAASPLQSKTLLSLGQKAPPLCVSLQGRA
jgi:hypothetical protein